MSKIGLNAGIYQTTGRYLNLINDVIVEIKTQPKLKSSKREDLVEVFKKISDNQNIDPQIQLIESIIERDLWGQKRKRIKPFIIGLLAELENPNSTGVVEKLETIADALDVEHSEAFSKIKGE